MTNLNDNTIGAGSAMTGDLKGQSSPFSTEIHPFQVKPPPYLSSLINSSAYHDTSYDVKSTSQITQNPPPSPARVTLQIHIPKKLYICPDHEEKLLSKRLCMKSSFSTISSFHQSPNKARLFETRHDPTGII